MRTKKHIKKRNSVDFTFLLVVIVLLIFGLTMVFSASSASAHYLQGDALYYIKKQLIFAVLGLISMWFVSIIDYRVVQKLALPMLGITFVLLVLVLIPGVGINTKGATRWLGVAGFTIQPSELAKFTIIIFLAHALSVRKTPIDKFWSDFVPYLAVIGVFAGLVLLEPHLSGAVVIAAAGCLVLFLGGAKMKHFGILTVPAILALGVAIAIEPYRLTRFTTFLHPFEDMLGDGYQIVQSLYAIGSGGFFGLGLGQSRQKFLYIPEPHNDFIFSIICEELGFFGALAVILLFVLLVWRGIKIAMAAPDKFSALTVGGIIGLIAFQVLVNIAVVTGSVPVTGMPLPFFSAGGTALLFLLTSVGFVLNISRHMEKPRKM